ncbi:MAG TPA: metallophosphoesterase [Solirubrobacterales bacterium]
MRTAIVSDLHLGSQSGEDLLRDAAIRRTLLEEIGDADRVVLLGDVLELRELPLAEALEISRPFFEELGEKMGGGEVLLIPGNHDHRLAEPVLENLAFNGAPALGLEHRQRPASEAGVRIDRWLDRTELCVAYPGAWLRNDVYATHGHYMDCHMSLPRMECVAVAAVMRVGTGIPEAPGPADYERVLQPIYGLSFGLAQSGLARGITRPSERVWRSLSGRRQATGRARRTAMRAAVGTAVPAGVWAVNRLLGAGFDADLSAAAITRSGIVAATETARRLRLDAVHVITGHTHRGGPREDEAPWPLPGGGQLHNTGSWVFASAFHHPGTPPGPYWPGTVTWLEDEEPPRRVQLLAGHTRERLKETVARNLSAES